MTYYINPIWFYLINLASGTKVFLLVVGSLTMTLAIFTAIIYYIDAGFDITDMNDDEKMWMKKWIMRFTKIFIAGIITLFIGVLVPSKETCVEMMIASQVTHENVSATKEEIYEIIDYMTDKVNKTEKVEEE